MRWFASQELNVWESMLAQIDFPDRREIIGDARAEAEVNLARVDYSDVTELAEELGMLDSGRGQDSFGQAGLIH